jgi:hypothetical protein
MTAEMRAGLGLVHRARALPYRSRIAVILASAIAVLVVDFFLPRIPQDPTYHNFADQRALWGIPNFGDVVSNAAFLVVGGLGLIVLFGRSATAGDRTAPVWLPFVVYFAGVGLVAFGSAYYHWNPLDETLFWDRLPMSIAFMALFAAIITDRIHDKSGRILLPFLVGLGMISVIYWHMTEQAGHGDLRFYAVVQFFPMLAVPLICLLFSPHRLDCRYLVPMFGFYALAKVCEYYDDEIFALLGLTVSGHTLKHVLAAAAALMALPMLRPKGLSEP